MSQLYVVFQVGTAEYVLPASVVLQLDSYEGATPVPGALAHVAGVIQIRGQVVPVVDLRQRFGLQKGELSIDSRVVVAQRGDRTVALLVDRAREVIRLSPEQLRPPPRLLAEQGGGVVKAVAPVGKRLLLELDYDKVFGEEQADGR